MAPFPQPSVAWFIIYIKAFQHNPKPAYLHYNAGLAFLYKSDGAYSPAWELSVYTRCCKRSW